MAIPIIDRKKGPSPAFSVKAFKAELEEVIKDFGYDLETLTPHDKGVIAEKMSAVVGQAPVWTWRYVHNVLHEKINPSKSFIQAIGRLQVILDDGHPFMVRSTRVNVYALGKVSPGTVILSDSRRCANSTCPIEFVPRVPNQRCCSPECSRARHNIMKKPRSN